jgi:CTP:molybdopterin cytidylyltransferase MocA
VTVAAVVLAGAADAALADAAGRPAVRRIAETAWSGGAIPVIVAATDPTGSVGEALGGSEATVAQLEPGRAGVDAQLAAGVEAALAAVSETEAVLLWPAAMTWVDPETITTLIQAHGLDRERGLRPTWEGTPGWPVLVPVSAVGALIGRGSHATPDDLIAGLDLRKLDLGDPGTVHDRNVPIDQLPGYQGPATPVAPPPEWGAAAAEVPET